MWVYPLQILHTYDTFVMLTLAMRWETGSGLSTESSV